MCISIHPFLSKFEKRKLQPIQKRFMKNNIFKFTKKHLENLLGILSLPWIKLTCFWTTVPRSRLFKNWISIEPGLKLNPIIQFVCFRSLVDENIIHVGKKTRLTFNWLEFVDHLWIELICMVGKTPPSPSRYTLLVSVHFITFVVLGLFWWQRGVWEKLAVYMLRKLRAYANKIDLIFF